MRRFVVSGFVSAIAATFSVHALAASPADVSAADALFREARAAARHGDHATACPKFRASYQLDPAVGTLLNVADCEEHEGHLVNALKRFEEALPRLPASDDRIPYVRSRIHALDERIPRFVGKVGPRLQVKVDGVLATATATAVSQPVDPGTHELHIEAPGRDEHLVIVLGDGERKEIDFTRSLSSTRAPAPSLGTGASASAHPASAPPSPPPSHSRALGFVIGGLGLGALAVGGVAVAKMFDAKSTADAHCFGSECDQAGIDATKSGKTWGTVGAATIGAGVLGLGIGTWLVFRDRAHEAGPSTSGSPERKRTIATADGASVERNGVESLSLSPLVSPTAGGLVLRGTL